MTTESEKLEVTKTGNESPSDTAAGKRIDEIAEEAAKKSSRTEQKYDNENQIFSK